MRIFGALLLTLSLLGSAFAQDYYKALGIDKSASARDIKRAYRTLSKKFHPDKNRSPEAPDKFRAVAEAYETLSNTETREIYDRYGAEGVKQHQSGGSQRGGHDPFDLFSRFFGGGGGGGGMQKRRGQNMEVKITLPLRDFYTGATKEFEVEKTQLCEVCEGSGSKDGHTETCGSCGGRGMRIVKHMLAPGIFQQVQTVCDVCRGKGETIAHPCETCGGQKVVRKVVSHTLEVERGVERGGRVLFEEEADESPDTTTGDLIVHLEEAKPGVEEAGEEEVKDGGWEGSWFRRRGRDLFYTEVLGVGEAMLGGWERTIRHLDGHEVVLKREKGVTVQPGWVERVEGEGMPVEGTDEFGDLVVEYKVVLPDQMKSGMRKELWALFEKWKKKEGGKDEL